MGWAETILNTIMLINRFLCTFSYYLYWLFKQRTNLKYLHLNIAESFNNSEISAPILEKCQTNKYNLNSNIF